MAWVLRAIDVSGQTRWRWLLQDDDGCAVADHEVDLSPVSAEYEAFCDLDGYVRRNAAPDDLVAAEAAIVSEVGAWIGDQVLGPAIGAAIVDGDHDTVWVEVPAEADFLLNRPLELAHVDGVPLARRGVSLVYGWDGERRTNKEPIGKALRVLALFSMPSRTSPLALRRERYELAHRVRFAGQNRKAVFIRVLQYGVTRERLRAYAEEPPGWDVLHIAGHGGHGEMLLEKPDGTPDLVSTADLVALLRPARRRLKLAVLGACHSGATTAAETLRRLNLPNKPDDQAPHGGTATTSLARGLVEAFGVAAVGMRYPVTDEFAISLTNELYPRLLAGAPVDQAMGLAVPAAAGSRPSQSRPALSLGTPAVFGSSAIGLRMPPPDGDRVLDPYRQRMPWFPAEPKRFVGRNRLMIDASAALAPRSGRTGVLLLGMAGAGKSTAAKELAYQHEGVFGALAWWRAPDRNPAPGEALASLADAWEAQLPDVQMVDAIDDAAKFTRYLTRLQSMLRDEPVLLVLDNLESLLSRSSHWRDPMWTDLVDALTSHEGESRVVLTSRVTPKGLNTERVTVLPTHALSLTESVLLARELPNLRALLHEDREPSADVTADRQLVREVIHVVQGHPKLLEFADADAEDPARLRERLAARRADSPEDAKLAAYFATGASGLDGADFLRVLMSWTGDTVSDLPEPARVLVELLACLEETDRQTSILQLVWPLLWKENGSTPSLEEALAALRTAALVDDSSDDGVHVLHPGVAEAVRVSADPDRRAAVDDLLGDFWYALSRDRVEQEGDGDQLMTEAIVHAALAAAPYLLRRSQWDNLVSVLECALARDRSPGTAWRVVGYLRQAGDDTTDPVERLRCESAHASALALVHPVEAERLLRAVLEQAAGQPDIAAVTAGQLANLLRDHGRLSEALEVAQRRLPGEDETDPWARAGHEASALQILAAMGRSHEVLDRATEMLNELDAQPADDEPVGRWQILEPLLDAACVAARGLDEWTQALAFNQRIQDSERQRGAGTYEKTGTQFNTANLFTHLGRHRDAERLLLECQATYEELGDWAALGRVFSARAKRRRLRKQPERAIELEQVALRYVYRKVEVHGIAVCHNNLGGHMVTANRKVATAVAHLMAATMLWRVSWHADYDTAMQNLSMLVLPTAVNVLPADLDQLIARVEHVPGVQFGELFTRLVPDADARAELFTTIATHAERFFHLTDLSLVPHLPVRQRRKRGKRR